MFYSAYQLPSWSTVYNLHPRVFGTIGMHVLLDAVNQTKGARAFAFSRSPHPISGNCFSCSSSVPTLSHLARR